MTTKKAVSLLEKVRSVYDTLSSQLVERNELVKGCIIAILARKHLFELGPPGTAKSLGTEKVCQSVKGARYFEYQISMHSKPEDVYGPPRLSKLKQDIYERNTKGMLPEAHIVFLDEIWKASGGILNTLLRITDETRRFYNGSKVITTPLMSMFGASNELPENAELNALFDRFLLRYYVDDIVDDSNFITMLNAPAMRISEAMTLPDLTTAQSQVDKVEVDDQALQDLARLRRKLRGEGFSFSPRRWRESLQVLRANAWFEGRDQVTNDDFEMLSHVMWDKPEDRNKITQLIFAVSSPEVSQALELLDLAVQVHRNALDAAGTEAGIEANEKLKKIQGQLAEVKNGGAKVEEIVETVREMKREVLLKCLGVES